MTGNHYVPFCMKKRKIPIIESFTRGWKLFHDNSRVENEHVRVPSEEWQKSAFELLNLLHSTQLHSWINNDKVL